MKTIASSRPQSRPLGRKSSLEEIRSRFDNDVERFSKLETGQQAAMDAPLILELVAQTASARLQPGGTILDIGCGAGNFTLRVLQEIRPLNCHLVDLSRPMLDRACSRIQAAGAGTVFPHQGDLRQMTFEPESFDCILAGAVLHHLREDADWARTFALLHRWLKPGGRLYVSDLVVFDSPEVEKLMWDRYARHLESVGGPDYRDKVFAYIDEEDSPRSLPYQLELLRRVGFSGYDVLHRNSVCACYFGTK